MKLHHLVSVLDAMAPFRYAEPWDNVGLLVGDGHATITRALLAIDCTEAVFEEALDARCELVIAYHPVIFKPLARIGAGSLVHRAIRAGVAFVCPHTALDVASGGTNDVLADIAGVTDRAPLRVTRPEEGVGIGRVGHVSPVERRELVARIKRGLGVDALLVAGPEEGVVTRVAVGAGACGDLLDDALAAEAGLYLTGEMRHHDALRAAAKGLTVVCALHSNSERVTLARLADRLRHAAPQVEFALSERDRDPFSVR